MGENRVYQNWAKVGVSVLLVGVSMALVQYKVPTIMLALMEQFEMSAAVASWLMSIFCLMMIPLAIPSGFACAKFGPRKYIAVAAVLMAVGTLVGAFTSNAVLLMIDRALEGSAVCILTVCAPVFIGMTVDPARTGSAMGLWGMWGCLGSAVAALATPTVYAACGTTGLWLSYAAVMVVVTIAMFMLVKAPQLPQSEALEVSDAEKPSIAQVFTKDTLLFFVGFIAFNVVLLAVLSFVPTILQAKGMSQTLSGFVSTLPMLLSVISSLAFGMLSDKTGQTKWLLVVTLAFLGPCAFVLYNFTGPVMWVSAVVMGLIGMGSSGLIITAFMKVLPDPRLADVGMGVLITVQGIGQFLGSFAVQALLGADMSNTFFAGCVVMVVAVLGTCCVALAHFRR